MFNLIPNTTMSTTTTNTQSGLLIAKITVLTKLEADKNGSLPVKFEPILGKYVKRTVLAGTVFDNMREDFQNKDFKPNAIVLLKWDEVPHKKEDEQEAYGNSVRYTPLQVFTEDPVEILVKYQATIGMAVEVPMLNPGPQDEE